MFLISANQLNKVLYQCLNATANGPFFEDWEFETLIGATRCEVAEIIANWPKTDKHPELVDIVINNSINNLLGYPHGKQKEWTNYISISPSELQQFFIEWKQYSNNKT